MEIPRPSCALVLVLLFITHRTECMNGGKINFREKEKQILDQILGPGRYDARIRPSGINGTGEQTFGFELRKVHGGNDGYVVLGLVDVMEKLRTSNIGNSWKKVAVELIGDGELKVVYSCDIEGQEIEKNRMNSEIEKKKN